MGNLITQAADDFARSKSLRWIKVYFALSLLGLGYWVYLLLFGGFHVITVILIAASVLSLVVDGTAWKRYKVVHDMEGLR